MSGHSKWKTIKHKKGILDAKRGKAFTKLIKEITIAARVGGGDSGSNPRLRTLLEKSREINMPIDNAQRAIKKGTGELPGQSYEAYTYEGYGPGGIAVITEVLTDNKNRAIAELRHAFSKKGGVIGETNSVNWMFEKMGNITAHKTDTTKNVTEDDLLEKLLDFDIADITLDDETFYITCNPKALDEVKKAVIDSGLKVESAEIEWTAKNTMSLNDEASEQALDFLTYLEELEDVQNVYTNLE
jgi:YebC/PmpR family DNA-binding regulatory protein